MGLIFTGRGLWSSSRSGCLLILRDTVQYATDIDQAIAHVRSLKRGVPWIYIIADDNSPAYGNSVILECGRSDSMDIEKVMIGEVL